MTYAQSNIGGRTENQDIFGSAQTKFGELIVVCDGMGGHNGGNHDNLTAALIELETSSK